MGKMGETGKLGSGFEKVEYMDFGVMKLMIWVLVTKWEKK
jgi:hypothetical protein